MSTPLPGVLYGITHTEEGAPIIRQPRVLKVGIGLPKGKAINVWIHNDGKWMVRLGYDKESKVTAVPTMAEARGLYEKHYSNAPECPYPRKTSFFTFTESSTNDVGVQVFRPAWETIEAHGSMPTTIPIVFTTDDPYGNAGTGYRMYSATELKCKGDGVNALRVLSMADTAEEKALAAEAKVAEERFFPILEGCWTKGCKYAKPLIVNGNERRQCTPHMDLVFQVVKNIRLGNTAYCHTTGIASISNIFSSLNDIKVMSGGKLVGIPMLLSVKQFKTMHNGKAGSAYMVLVEPTPQAGAKLIAQWATRPGPARIEAPTEETAADGDDEEESPLSAEAIHAEFMDGDDEEEGPSVPATDTPKSKTDDKTQALADRLTAKATPTGAQSVTTQEQQPVQTQSTTGPQPVPDRQKRKDTLF